MNIGVGRRQRGFALWHHPVTMGSLTPERHPVAVSRGRKDRFGASSGVTSISRVTAHHFGRREPTLRTIDVGPRAARNSRSIGVALAEDESAGWTGGSAVMAAALPARLEYRHVDVFTDVPFAGNGLIVLFGAARGLRAQALISLTIEMRQFELILVDADARSGRVVARIFTAQEELPFAGHPVIGAAAVLHERYAAREPSRSWTFVIAAAKSLCALCEQSTSTARR